MKTTALFIVLLHINRPFWNVTRWTLSEHQVASWIHQEEFKKGTVFICGFLCLFYIAKTKNCFQGEHWHVFWKLCTDGLFHHTQYVLKCELFLLDKISEWSIGRPFIQPTWFRIHMFESSYCCSTHLTFEKEKILFHLLIYLFFI